MGGFTSSTCLYNVHLNYILYMVNINQTRLRKHLVIGICMYIYFLKSSIVNQNNVLIIDSFVFWPIRGFGHDQVYDIYASLETSLSH